MANLENDHVKRGVALTVSTFLNSREFENELFEYLAACQGDEGGPLGSIEIHDIETLETTIRFVPPVGGPRYFSIKVKELM